MNDAFKPIRPLRGAHVQTILASSRYRAMGKNPMAEAARELLGGDLTLLEARDVRTMIDRSGCRALGIVVNGVGKKRGGYYRAHYKGHHIAE